MNTNKFAKHILEHPVLFVGDSITQLQYESLGCLLGNHFPNRHPNNTVNNGGNSKIRVNQLAPTASNQVALAYVRSDYLIRIDDYKLIEPYEKEGTLLGSGENHPW
jgi:DNA polymerase phi